MKRVLAVIVAVVLVGGAVLIRNAIDSKDSPGTPSGSTLPSRPLTLVCATELTEACQELAESDSAKVGDLTFEPAADTAGRLAKEGGTLGADAWVVAEPWPAIVEARRKAANLDPVFGPAASVGSARLQLAIRPETATALRATCKKPPAITWDCIGAAAGTPIAGRPFTLAAATGADTSGVLTATAFAVAAYGNVTFASNDLADDLGPLFTGLGGAGGSSPGEKHPIEKLLGQPVATAAAEIGTTIDADTAKQRGFDLITPEPAVAARAQVVSVGRAGAAVVSAIGSAAIKQAMGAAGWGGPTSPAPALPVPAVVDAVGALWKDKTP